MLISLLIFLLLSNAVTSRQHKTILFSRIVITGLILSSYLALNNPFTQPLEKGVGIYGGLFNVTSFTLSFNIFLFLVSSVILTLTASLNTSISVLTLLVALFIFRENDLI